MLVPTKKEKDFIYSLIFDEKRKFEELILNGEINYDRILSIISLNRIEYFFLDKLNNTSKSYQLPINFLNKLEKNYLIKSIITLKIIEKVFILSNKLIRSNIEHVFLKGITLHDQNRKYLRPMRDIDLLVNKKDIPQVVDLANLLNFKFINEGTELLDNFTNNSLFHDLPPMVDDNGVFLEIHFRITTKSDNCYLKDNIFKSKRLIKIHGINIYAPCQNSLFAHLVYHGSKKGNFDVGLTALVDILQLSDKVNKNKVLRISESIELKKLSELFFELTDFFKNKKIILSVKARKLKEVLIFPPLNPTITEILTQESFLKMLIKIKEVFFASELQLDREFGSNKSLPRSFYLVKRWIRQLKKFYSSFFFVLKNLSFVNKRNKTIKDLLKK